MGLSVTGQKRHKSKCISKSAGSKQDRFVFTAHQSCCMPAESCPNPGGNWPGAINRLRVTPAFCRQLANSSPALLVVPVTKMTFGGGTSRGSGRMLHLGVLRMLWPVNDSSCSPWGWQTPTVCLMQKKHQSKNDVCLQKCGPVARDHQEGRVNLQGSNSQLRNKSRQVRHEIANTKKCGEMLARRRRRASGAPALGSPIVE